MHITTKYIGPTDTRGSRIKASFNGKTLTIPYDHSLNSDDLHFKAASAFANKHKLIVDYANYDDAKNGYRYPIVGLQA